MYPISEQLQDAFHNKIVMDNRVIAYKDYDQHFKVYTDALDDRGHVIKYKQPEDLLPGDTVVASEAQVYETIEKKYTYDLVSDHHGLKVYHIKAVR